MSLKDRSKASRDFFFFLLSKHFLDIISIYQEVNYEPYKYSNTMLVLELSLLAKNRKLSKVVFHAN